MAKRTDQKTLDLIKEVNRRKAEIQKLQKPNWLTNCSFTYVDGSNLNNAINIHVQTSVKELISMAGFLQDKERQYNEAITALGIEDPPVFQWGGFSVADWIEDIKTRINQIQIAAKKKKLETLESRLNAVISPELRAEMELDAIAGELG